ncbi:putative EF-Hand 1, calcium-binding protein [Rosa chinensis]|uniref:Putative EF-Hand 1, calcium-binding protein n=1 Tax=Rosa chinensis TaxID=74649 RepID=A0A2P6Q8E2_ROSCH|nr:putative EF-Hand 1, calcium-binding protein [Rosa chinensis]
MEELLQAAVAYYNNGSNNLRELASNFFKSMDTNRDRRVSRSEFVRFLQQSGYNINPYIFNALDRNGDGYLDFWEVLTLYYIIKTRLYHCADCGVRLLGLYFTCVECFDRAGDTYDLCSICYSARQFRHSHTLFLDNHMLLIAKRRQARGSHNLNQVLLILFLFLFLTEQGSGLSTAPLNKRSKKRVQGMRTQPKPP